MTDKKASLFRIYAFSTIVSLGLIVFVGLEEGLSALGLVFVLAALEITFSFDNAIINAKILARMSPGWQQAFLTIGILIAVFGVRVILPVLIVALAAGLSFGSVVDLALNHPEEYGEHLHEAHPVIAAFGGMFLLMIFLQYFLAEREVKWLKWIETTLQKAGRLPNLSILLALAVLFIASHLVDGHERVLVLEAGIVGLLVFLIIHSLDALLSGSKIGSNLQHQTKATFKAGLIGFLYLEVIDASFSLDGVIGAFAITDKLIIIAVGLGIGALYVRTLTLHILRRGTLQKYRYMEHGAHYAIGILATLMLLSLKFEIPEAITGMTGIVVITAAVIHSVIDNKRAQKTKSLV